MATAGNTNAQVTVGTTSGGQVTVGTPTWTVDLGALADSITLVSSRALSIENEYDNITTQYETIEMGGTGASAAVWSSPAGNTFNDVATQVTNVMSTLQQLLGDMVTRMRQTYDNYVQAETTNVNNVSQGQ